MDKFWASVKALVTKATYFLACLPALADPREVQKVLARAVKLREAGKQTEVRDKALKQLGWEDQYNPTWGFGWFFTWDDLYPYGWVMGLVLTFLVSLIGSIVTTTIQNGVGNLQFPTWLVHEIVWVAGLFGVLPLVAGGCVRNLVHTIRYRNALKEAEVEWLQEHKEYAEGIEQDPAKFFKAVEMVLRLECDGINRTFSQALSDLDQVTLKIRDDGINKTQKMRQELEIALAAFLNSRAPGKDGAVKHLRASIAGCEAREAQLSVVPLWEDKIRNLLASLFGQLESVKYARDRIRKLAEPYGEESVLRSKFEHLLGQGVGPSKIEEARASVVLALLEVRNAVVEILAIAAQIKEMSVEQE